MTIQRIKKAAILLGVRMTNEQAKKIAQHVNRMKGSISEAEMVRHALDALYEEELDYGSSKHDFERRAE